MKSRIYAIIETPAPVALLPKVRRLYKVSMNTDNKEGGKSTVTLQLTERQEIVLNEANKATGVSLGALISTCIDMNIEYLRRITDKVKPND